MAKDSLKKSHCFFERKGLSIGTGIGKNLSNNATFINPRLYYNLTKNICLGPEYAYSFYSHEYYAQELNLVVHYIFEIPYLGVYPVFGGTYSMTKEDDKVNKEFGLITGIGVHRMYKKVIFYLEYDLMLFKDYSEQKIGLGLFYNFNL